MGMKDFFARMTNPLPEPPKANGVSFQTISRAVSGTENYGGYLEEDYLDDLKGTKGARKYDEMRRADANIQMILSAIKLPIRSAQWTIGMVDDSPEAEAQKALIEHILFKDMGKTWTQFTGEALTFLEFGFSLFEVTHKPVLAHPKFGSYVGIKRLGFRKQKTIERWLCTRDGVLTSVEQQADGDYSGLYMMDSRFLLHFCPDQEGDNFEGMSRLRACYGPYFRKNLYLKLMAAAIEKYGIPTPKLKVPKNKESSPEIAAAIDMLKKYTSNQTNFMTFPEGWELDIIDVSTDPDKILQVIKYEDQAMANSFLAAFLLLGQNSSGSYSLGSTLSDFFATAVQFFGDHICEVFNNRLIPELVKLNFGNQECLIEMKVEGIKDAATQTFATTIDSLVKAGVLKSDDDLEKFVREKFKLPVKAEVIPPTSGQNVLQLAEKRGPNQSKLIRSSAQQLREMIDAGLTAMGVKYIEKMRREYQSANATQRLKIPNNLELTMPQDLVDILVSLSLISAHKATEGIKGEMTLGDMDDRLSKIQGLIDELNDTVDEYEKTREPMLSLKISTLQRQIKARLAYVKGQIDIRPKTAASIKSRVQTMTTTQAGDLKKKIDLQYQGSVGSTDSERTLFGDLEEARQKFQSSPVVNAGPDILASQNINEAILQETEGEPEVESYTFVAVDDDATTDICRELNGRTFSKDDPDLFRFSPPLHHNCRSYMAVNLASMKNNPQITEEPLELSKKAQAGVTLSEELQRKIFGST